MSEYNILLLKQDKQWYNILDLKLPTLDVYVLNASVVKHIMDVQGFGTEPSKGIHKVNDDLEYIFMKTMRYRCCTIYIVMQYSNNTQQFRALAFATDQMMHSGSSFGTTLDLVKISDIVDHITKESSNIKYSNFISSKIANSNNQMFA